MATTERVPAGAILLVDGVFLQRRELAGGWEARVFLQVSAAETLRRALERDTARFGSEAAVRERYVRRYLPAQRLYAERVQPARKADVVFDNEDLYQPWCSVSE